ncbi:adenosylcobinamide-GDP ribazoletransferase [uncultured Shimia sp.]|uniref:adenosylcobinamide-GDP ribazoletransferase n=1 Tax=uncultured Shimia sp. TaxID=573152 RepID=UPI002624993B|nr:adenosylcobinamide-GDP ribazoletransferase [uncultured Shimia sp.]
MHSDDKWRLEPGDLATALALLTRLPVRARFERGAAAAWAYPVAGVAVAVIAAVPTGLALALGVPTMLAAILWVATHVIVTGAMHEDGLADSADGLWGGWNKDQRLEIMKDSHIGSYGVIALCLSLAARWAAVGMILQLSGWFWALLAVDVMSRAVMPAVMSALPHARETGLSHAQGRPSREMAAIALLIGCGSLVLASGLGAIGLAVCAALTVLICGAIAKSKIGGQTGDILGATQQLTEIVLLIVLAT